MFVLARELLGIGRRVRVGCAIGIPFQGDRRNADHRELGEPLLQSIVFGLTFRQSKPPAVIVDRDRDVIRVVECRSAAIEGGIVEIPLRRSKLPDQLGEVAPVFLVAGAASPRCEVVGPE
jgi:hypothetical protein